MTSVTSSSVSAASVALPWPYASFGARFVAAIIDFGLIYLVSAVIGLTGGEAAVPLTFLIWTVGGWLYFGLMEGGPYQASIGKVALGLRVSRADGQKLGFGRASLRYVGKYISFYILGIGFLLALFTPRKQALDDFLASSVVLAPFRSH